MATALFAELEGHDARLVAADRVAAERDAWGGDAALVRVLVEPAHDEITRLCSATYAKLRQSQPHIFAWRVRYLFA